MLYFRFFYCLIVTCFLKRDRILIPLGPCPETVQGGSDPIPYAVPFSGDPMLIWALLSPILSDTIGVASGSDSTSMRYTLTPLPTQATLRNFLRLSRRTHKKHLASSVAICEFAIDLK